MNKKKALLVTLGMGAIGFGKIIVCKILENKKRRKQLEENLVALSLLQDDFNTEVMDEIQSVKEEIGSVYEHIEKLLEMQEVQCKYADECEESDCFYEEFLDKAQEEVNEMIREKNEEMKETK